MRSGAASTTGSGQSSGGFRKGSCADALLRFWWIPVQIPGEVSEGLLQIASEVAQGSGAGRFQRVKVQVAGEVPEGFGADTVPCEVLEDSDADTW